jgi:putative ABC transport system permease protein
MGNILALTSWDFIKLVLIANLVAWPLIYLVMNDWLNNFANRIGIDYFNFIIAGCIVMIIAVLTISVQSMKAAAQNPVHSLRSE